MPNLSEMQSRDQQKTDNDVDDLAEKLDGIEKPVEFIRTLLAAAFNKDSPGEISDGEVDHWMNYMACNGEKEMFHRIQQSRDQIRNKISDQPEEQTDENAGNDWSQEFINDTLNALLTNRFHEGIISAPTFHAANGMAHHENDLIGPRIDRMQTGINRMGEMELGEYLNTVIDDLILWVTEGKVKVRETEDIRPAPMDKTINDLDVKSYQETVRTQDQPIGEGDTSSELYRLGSDQISHDTVKDLLKCLFGRLEEADHYSEIPDDRLKHYLDMVRDRGPETAWSSLKPDRQEDESIITDFIILLEHQSNEVDQCRILHKVLKCITDHMQNHQKPADSNVTMRIETRVKAEELKALITDPTNIHKLGLNELDNEIQALRTRTKSDELVHEVLECLNDPEKLKNLTVSLDGEIQAKTNDLAADKKAASASVTEEEAEYERLRNSGMTSTVKDPRNWIIDWLESLDSVQQKMITLDYIINHLSGSLDVQMMLARKYPSTGSRVESATRTVFNRQIPSILIDDLPMDDVQRERVVSLVRDYNYTPDTLAAEKFTVGLEPPKTLVPPFPQAVEVYCDGTVTNRS